MRTSSVAANRHGMPRPTVNDTGTAFCFSNDEMRGMHIADEVSLWP